jgi:hypothetical protein
MPVTTIPDPTEAANTKARMAGLLVLAAAVVVFGIAETAVRAIEPRLEPPVLWGDLETQWKVAQMDGLAAKGGADVVFLGSSIVNAGIDPALYAQLSESGTVAYNAALNATSPQLLELWAGEIVLPRLQPDLVVIGLSSRELNDHGISQTEQYDRYVESIARAFEIAQPTIPQRIDRAMSEVSAVVRLRSEIRRPFVVFNELRGTTSPSLVLTDQGATTRLRGMEYHVPEEFRDRTVNRDLVDYQVGGVEMGALSRLVDEIRSTGAEVLLVDMPVVEAAYVPMHPNGRADFDAYRAALREFADQNDVQLIIPPDQPWPAEQFADPLHLNQSGVDELTTWLWETTNAG